MTITGKRLDRLERQLGIDASREPLCPHCGSEGCAGLVVIRAADPDKPLHPVTTRGGCPECGRVNAVIKYFFALMPGDDPTADPWDVCFGRWDNAEATG